MIRFRLNILLKNTIEVMLYASYMSLQKAYFLMCPLLIMPPTLFAGLEWFLIIKGQFFIFIFLNTRSTLIFDKGKLRTLRQILNEYVSKILFNLFFNEGTNKMLQLVQRKIQRADTYTGCKLVNIRQKQPTVFLIDKFHFCRQESSAVSVLYNLKSHK